MALVPTGFKYAVKFESRKWASVKKGFTQFQNGDVIFAKITPCFENSKAAIISNLPNQSGSGSTEYFVLRPILIPSKYLYYFIKSQAFLKSGEAVMTGSVGQKRVPSEYVRTRPIPLPPLTEQHRIVAKLDAILPRVEKVRERVEKIPALVKRFRQSVLTAAVTGKLTEQWRKKNPGAGEWRDSTIGNVIGNLSQGWSPQCLNEGSANPKDWAVIKTTAVQHLRFHPEENKCLPRDLSPRPEHEIKVGDLIITRAGPRIRAGVCCLVKEVRPRLMLCDKAYRFRANPERAISGFLEIFLNAPDTLEVIDRMKTGISDSGVNITQSGFQAIKLLLPSLNEQIQIVNQVYKLFALADKLEAHYRRAMARVEKFPQAILTKAFRGELVPQDPSDEPAERLLERIRQEREKLEGAPKSSPSRKPQRVSAKTAA